MQKKRAERGFERNMQCPPHSVDVLTVNFETNFQEWNKSDPSP